MFFKWLKQYMPRSLYGRSALILVAPVVVLQLVVSVAFIQRHLEDVTTQMALNMARELKVIVTQIDASASQAAAIADNAPFADAFQVQMRFVSYGDVPDGDVIGWFEYSGRVVRNTFRATIPQMRAIEFEDNNNIRLFLDTKLQPVEVVFNRRRVTAAAPHQLIVTMIFFGALMTVIAFIYMRNQLRPITRLAAAAEAFGKGRTMPYSPSGATEVRAAGGAFLDMRARIERQIEQRTLMLSGVSHDLRTPLTRMRLGLSLLDDDEAEPLLRDVDEMQRLLDAFLDFSKGASEGDAEACDPHALIRKVVEDALRSGKDVKLIEEQGSGEVMLRPTAMRRAVENLLGNAIRYGTRAEVSVVMTDKSLRIRVEDDGPGIPSEQRSEAIKPFTRLDPSRNQNLGGGVGLGLAIVNDIARAHGGVLRLGKSSRLGGLQADIVIGR